MSRSTKQRFSPGGVKRDSREATERSEAGVVAGVGLVGAADILRTPVKCLANS